MTRSIGNTVPYDGPAPEYAHTGDAGFDLRADLGGEGEYVSLNAGDRGLVSTGLRLELPVGTVGLVCPRSGLALNYGVTVANAPGVVDSSFRGVVKVILINHSSVPFVISHGDRIAQLLIQPVLTPATGLDFVQIDHPDQLSPTLRSDGGFGSTGVQ